MPNERIKYNLVEDVMQTISQSPNSTPHEPKGLVPLPRREPHRLPAQTRYLNMVCRSVTIPYGKHKLFSKNDRQLMHNYDLKETEMHYKYVFEAICRFPDLTIRRGSGGAKIGNTSKVPIKKGHKKSKHRRNYSMDLNRTSDNVPINTRNSTLQCHTLLNEEEEYEMVDPTTMLEDIIVDCLYLTHTNRIRRTLKEQMKTEPVYQRTRSKIHLPRLSYPTILPNYSVQHRS